MKSAFLMALSIGVLLAGGLPQVNPVRTATAGAYYARVRGNHAVGLNPANLGYYMGVNGAGQSGRASGAQGIKPTQGRYWVQLIASPDEALVNRTKIAFRRRYGNSIPSAITRVDSLYKLRAGDFERRDTATAFRTSLVAAGYGDAWVVTVNHRSGALGPVPYVTVTLLGGSVNVGNNAVDTQWINQQLYGGRDLRETGKKNKFLSIFTDDIWNVNLMAGLTGLSFTAGNFGVSLFEPQVMSNLNLPTEILDVLLRGVKFDEPRQIAVPNMDLLAVAPLSVAFGRRIDLPQLAGWANRFYVGAGVNLLIGLADAHLLADQLNIATTPDSVTIEGRTRVIANVNRGSRWFTARGSGLSFDLGLAADINPQLSVGMTLKDLLGRMRWPRRTVTERVFSMQLSSQDLEDIYDYSDDQIDSLRQSFTTLDTSYVSGPGRTVYPTQFILGAAYRALPELTVDAACMYTLDNDYLESTAPQLSIGLEYARWPQIPLYFGLGLGGIDGLQWGAGFTLNLDILQWSLGYGESRGLLNSAKGAAFSTEWRLVF